MEEENEEDKTALILIWNPTFLGKSLNLHLQRILTQNQTMWFSFPHCPHILIIISHCELVMRLSEH